MSSTSTLTGPRMRDCAKRDPALTKTVSLQERVAVANKRASLGKNITIIRLTITSKVPDVIDGNSTIPVLLEVALTWNQVFDMLNIKFDPKQHLLRAYGRFIDDFSAPIHKLYSTYKNRRENYCATILAKDALREIPKRKKRAVRRRKDFASASGSGSGTFSHGKANTEKRIDHPKIPKKKIDANVNVIKQKQHKNNASAANPKSNNNWTSSPSDCDISKNAPHAELQGIGSGTKDNGGLGLGNTPAQFRFKSSSAFVQRVGSANPPGQSPILTFSTGEFVDPPPQLAFRDESTMAGDIILPQEIELKSKILQYLNGHCSNRDMLSMRTELLGLKRAMKFQALNRLIPFTAGILQNAFLDTVATITDH